MQSQGETMKSKDKEVLKKNLLRVGALLLAIIMIIGSVAGALMYIFA